MADVENGDILRIGAVMKLETAFDIANVFHCRVISGGAKTYAAVLGDVQEYMDDLYDYIDTYIHNTQLADHLTLANVTQDTVYGALDWGVFAGGSESQDKTAPGVCLLTWARTLKPRVQVRKYWGVFSEVNMTGGLWLTTIQTQCRAALQYHINENTLTDGLELGGVAYNRTLGTYTDPVSVASSGEPSYQRRRKRGRGS